jgi:2,4-dienoyl-CoA reductase-like NADH-dependent reductase (Old Yellow Enzyme family)/pyruvate/2-oxoglutarate dehydrogenase complex dihydrolipoamide dehydrogenase (E3) component
MGYLPELYEPMVVGPMTVANRLMMAGMSAGTHVDANKEVSEEMIAYYVERARGEPGMMAIGATPILPPVPGQPQSLSLHSDFIIPSMQRLVNAVHEFDTKLGIQLWNGGGTEMGRYELISPSGLASNVRNTRADDGNGRRTGQPNRALELEDIPQVVQYFADAAVRVVKCGFDFVEIHGGHGYLISNFMTPLFNQRTDEYGGSFENRSRFLLDVVRAVKAAVGDKIAVGLKYNGDDFLGDKGWTLEESCRLAPLAEAAGADYITVTAGLVGSPKLTIPPMYEPQGCYTSLAEAVKPTVSIPVGTIGRIKDPVMARDLVVEGKADFVCMGRPTIADSDIFGKTKRGQLEDIRPCLADCRGCIDEHLIRGGAASCVVNPRMSRELTCIDVQDAKKDDPKRVLVIGGGLAGMEAARATAFSGHHVTLCESREHLGGQILFAAMIPGRGEIGEIVPWYERQLEKLGVDVQCNTTVDESIIQALNPEIVFIASGSVPEVPQNKMNMVMNAANIDFMMVDDILEDGLVPGKHVLIVGGDQNGMLIADYLADGEREITIAEADSHFAQKLAAHDRWYLLNRQKGRTIRRVKEVRDIEVGGNDDVWLVTDEGREMVPMVDTIVFADERKSNRSVADLAALVGAQTVFVGDAKDVKTENSGTIFANIAQAYDASRSL